MAAHYLKADCTPKDQGSLLKNHELAARLRAIAKGGPKAFYCGPHRGLRICGMPPESSGTIAVLQTLGML